MSHAPVEIVAPLTHGWEPAIDSWHTTRIVGDGAQTRDARAAGLHLVLLRADGRLGPELKRTAVDCAALRKERAAGGAPPADPPGQVPNIDDRVPCNQRGFFGPQGVTLNASGRTLEQIATTLGTYADRLVVDKTGLTGEYDMLLKFRPEAGGPMGGLAAPLSTTADPLSDLATLGVAVREQLGLRLEPARGPVEVFVIDSISPPTEN